MTSFGASFNTLMKHFQEICFDGTRDSLTALNEVIARLKYVVSNLTREEVRDLIKDDRSEWSLDENELPHQLIMKYDESNIITVSFTFKK
jgi:hypothetical protein